MERKLSGKTVLITGANGAIGRNLVHRFTQNGASVICCVRDTDKNFQNFIDSITLASDQYIRTLAFDLADSAQTKHEIYSIIKEKIALDILVNNAAISYGSTIEMTSLDDLRSCFEINFFSQISLTTSLLRILKKSKHGRIINVGSLIGLIGERGTLAYGASKSALMFATKVMANEFAPYNITVNAVAPGIAVGGMATKMELASRKNILDMSFLKQEIGLDDISNLILFLASEEAGKITGQVLRVDGGMQF